MMPKLNHNIRMVRTGTRTSLELKKKETNPMARAIRVVDHQIVRHRSLRRKEICECA